MNNQQLQHDLKKEFQLERMILFSDAVFAIAITLLAIEIKVPAIDRHIATDAMLLHSLDELIPKFIGFFISFYIIGLYWTIHHRMFGYVVNYDKKLLWMNLVFLMAIVLMPFSTAFYSEYVVHFLKTPIVIYVLNIVLLGSMNFVIWRYINKPGLHLTEGVTEDDRKYFSFRAALVPIVFVAVALIYLFVDPKYAVWIPIFIPVSMRIFRKLYFRKSKPVKS